MMMRAVDDHSGDALYRKSKEFQPTNKKAFQRLEPRLAELKTHSSAGFHSSQEN